MNHDKPIKSSHIKSLNHMCVLTASPSLKFIPAVLVFLQPNKKNTSCQNSEVDFPCSIVMGPKTGRGPPAGTLGSWASATGRLTAQGDEINVSQMRQMHGLYTYWVLKKHGYNW